MYKRKVTREKQFNNVDYTQLTETDNGFVDSQVCNEKKIRLEGNILILENNND